MRRKDLLYFNKDGIVAWKRKVLYMKRKDFVYFNKDGCLLTILHDEKFDNSTTAVSNWIFVSFRRPDGSSRRGQGE